MNRLINPRLEFDDGSLIHGSAVASLDCLSEFIAPADLVISTGADESVESVINQVAVLEKRPFLYGRALRRGGMGRVFLVRPGRDARVAAVSAMIHLLSGTAWIMAILPYHVSMAPTRYKIRDGQKNIMNIKTKKA